ncbi:hypothetical protein CYLTODRAFT_324351, partial [Cylindrobasidium torrendii FP15055 ss-10]
YKSVDRKANPVAATLPEDAKVKRRFPENPLDTLPPLSPHPPDFLPTKRLTHERLASLGVLDNQFLLPEERRLAVHVLALNADAIAFDPEERGTFRDDYISPAVIPLVEHEPWARKSFPIPPGIRDEVHRQIDEKIRLGLLEPSDSSYRTQWFCVAKKNGK